MPSTDKTTLNNRLEDFFHHHVNEWVDARQLQRVAGMFAWRTRVSNLRYAPWNMKIRNRTRRVLKADGGWMTVSEYRYELAPEQPAAPEVHPS